MLRYRLPDGRSWKRLWVGWVGSFTILLALLEHRISSRALECDQFGRRCDLISQGCDFKKSEVALVRPAIREKINKSLRDSERLSAVQQQTQVRLISWSKPIRDSEGRTPPLIGRGPDIPVRVCTFEDACAAAVRQREIEVSSRDACSSFSESALFSVRLTVPPGFCDR